MSFVHPWKDMYVVHSGRVMRTDQKTEVIPEGLIIKRKTNIGKCSTNDPYSPLVENPNKELPYRPVELPPAEGPPARR